jgi:hypothetical protein
MICVAVVFVAIAIGVTVISILDSRKVSEDRPAVVEVAVEAKEVKKSIEQKKEIQKVEPVKVDVSHLSEVSQKIVQDWQSVDLEPFSCDKLRDDKLSFLFIPVQFVGIEQDAEIQMDFKLFSKFHVWAVNQEEPFSSYADVNQYYAYEGADQSRSDLSTNAYEIINELKATCLLTDANRPLIVLVINEKVKALGGGYAFMSQGAVYMKTPGYKKMIKNDKSAFLLYHVTPPHEIGHAYAGFLDEYTFTGREERNWPVEGYEYENERGVKTLLANNLTPFNHGKKVPTCPSLSEAKEMWGDLVDSEMSLSEPDSYQIGYYPGCYNYSNRYRASKRSMMSTASEFNLVQKRFLCELLIDRSDKILGECKKFFK